jgi:hypothetical protein
MIFSFNSAIVGAGAFASALWAALSGDSAIDSNSGIVAAHKIAFASAKSREICAVQQKRQKARLDGV